MIQIDPLFLVTPLQSLLFLFSFSCFYLPVFFICLFHVKIQHSIVTVDFFFTQLQVKITNHTKQPLTVNDENISKERPLFSDSIITINNNLRFRWEYQKCEADDRKGRDRTA